MHDQLASIPGTTKERGKKKWMYRRKEGENTNQMAYKPHSAGTESREEGAYTSLYKGKDLRSLR